MSYEEITLIFTCISVICVFLGYWAGRKKDAANDGEQKGLVAADLIYIKSRVDDIIRKQEQQDARYVEIIARIAKIEESAKQGHKRLDEHLKNDHGGGE